MAERLEATAVFRGGMATDVSAGGHTVRIDEPETVPGGGGTGMMPTELFIASLAGCFCLAIAWAARKRDIDVPGLSVSVTCERAGKELRYERIVVDTQAELEDAMLAEQGSAVEAALWSALEVLEERAELLRRMAGRRAPSDSLRQRFTDAAADADERARLIRRALAGDEPGTDAFAVETGDPG